MVSVFDGMMGRRLGGHSALMVLWEILSRIDSSAQWRKEQTETWLVKELLY
jgi:serine/threonine protein phosphatase PrpC